MIPTRKQLSEAQKHLRHAALYVIFNEQPNTANSEAFAELMSAQYEMARAGDLRLTHSCAGCGKYTETAKRKGGGSVKHSEKIRKIWSDAVEECSTVRKVTCSSCNGEATAFPYKEGKNGEFIPIGSAKPGVIRACVICRCCSFIGCTHCWWHGEMRDHHTLDADGACTRCQRTFRAKPGADA